jgi:hypothetical protein
MSAHELLETAEPVRPSVADRSLGSPRVRRVGRLRLPLAGPYRPWATLYRLPSGYLVWCLGLWHVDHVERRCVSTDTLRWFARLNRFHALLREIDGLVASATGTE